VEADEFLKKRTPKSKLSKLAPAWIDIQKLRAAGCSLYEIQDFLKANNIDTSVPNLAAFIKRQEAKPDIKVAVAKESPDLAPSPTNKNTDALELALTAKDKKFDELQIKGTTPEKLESRFNKNKG